MTTILSKPTSPGKRFTVSVKTEGLHKGKPYSKLIEKKSKTGGRNNSGKITTRHIGGGHKQKYRIIDFKRNKYDVPGIIERLEYDPNRSAHIMLVLYKDGERRYIIAPNKLKVGDWQEKMFQLKLETVCPWVKFHLVQVFIVLRWNQKKARKSLEALGLMLN